MTIFHDEIEIEDFDYDEDEEMYYYPCPCGDRFQISKANKYFQLHMIRLFVNFLIKQTLLFLGGTDGR